MDGLKIYIALRPRLAGKVSKIHIEIDKISAIEEIKERAKVVGSRVWAGGHSFEVKEGPEEIFEIAERLTKAALDHQILQ